MERLLWALERLSAVQRGLLWKRAFALGLTLTQAQVLLHLSKREGDRPTPLSEALGITPPTLSDALKALEEKGLLERTKGPGDGRIRTVRLTPRGLEAAQALEDWAKPLLLALEGKEEALDPLLEAIAELARMGVVREARLCLLCRFFSAPDYCGLIEKNLPELRLDCPDFAPQSPTASR